MQGGSATGILHGIRVLDFGRYVAGPFCAAMLADYGADVIRIDRIGGGEDRFVMPVTAEGEGALFLQCNRNKRSLSLDIESVRGRELVRKLVKTADVVVVNMPTAVLKKLGLDYVTLSALRPDIILTLVSAFGSVGPLSQRLGFEAIGQAMSGAAFMSGFPGQPVRSMAQPVDFACAMSAAFGTMAALYERRISGKGQQVEASLLLTALNQASGPLVEEAATGIGRRSTGNRSTISGPSDFFRVLDGWIVVNVIGQPMFKRWTQLVARPDLLDDPRFADDTRRGTHGEVLSDIMAQWCQSRTAAQALGELEQMKIPAGPVQSPRDVLNSEHVKEAGWLNPMDYPGLAGPAPILSPPASLSRTPPAIRLRAPRAGEHTDDILSELGLGRAEIAELRAASII